MAGSPAWFAIFPSESAQKSARQGYAAAGRAGGQKTTLYGLEFLPETVRFSLRIRAKAKYPATRLRSSSPADSPPAPAHRQVSAWRLISSCKNNYMVDAEKVATGK
jgi:hypothetical protein